MRIISFVFLACAVAASLPLLILADKHTPTTTDLVIASESFDYSEGTPLKGAHGGKGWASPWTTSALHKTDNVIGAGSMLFKNLASSGNRLVEVGSNVRSYRKIDTSRPELAALLDGGKFGKD